MSKLAGAHSRQTHWRCPSVGHAWTSMTGARWPRPSWIRSASPSWSSIRTSASSRKSLLLSDVRDESSGRSRSPVYALGDGQWNIPELRLLLEDVERRHAVMEAYEVEQDFSGIGRRAMLLNARKVFYEEGSTPRFFWPSRTLRAARRSAS